MLYPIMTPIMTIRALKVHTSGMSELQSSGCGTKSCSLYRSLDIIPGFIPQVPRLGLQENACENNHGFLYFFPETNPLTSCWIIGSPWFCSLRPWVALQLHHRWGHIMTDCPSHRSRCLWPVIGGERFSHSRNRFFSSKYDCTRTHIAHQIINSLIGFHVPTSHWLSTNDLQGNKFNRALLFLLATWFSTAIPTISNSAR